MNAKSSFAMIAFGAVLIAGCGKEVRSVGQRLEEPGLMNTWASKCGGSELLDVSALTLYRFSGANVKQVYELHNDGSCQKPLVRVIHEGDFALRGESSAVPGAKNVDIQFKKVTVVALNPDGQKLLEKASFCETKDWTIGQPVDVSAHAGGVKCPVTKTPRTEFDVVKVDRDALYFGKAKLFDNRSEPSERPTKLNADKPYFKTDRKVE